MAILIGDCVFFGRGCFRSHVCPVRVERNKWGAFENSHRTLFAVPPLGLISLSVEWKRSLSGDTEACGSATSVSYLHTHTQSSIPTSHNEGNSSVNTALSTRTHRGTCAHPLWYLKNRCQPDARLRLTGITHVNTHARWRRNYSQRMTRRANICFLKGQKVRFGFSPVLWTSSLTLALLAWHTCLFVPSLLFLITLLVTPSSLLSLGALFLPIVPPTVSSEYFKLPLSTLFAS